MDITPRHPEDPAELRRRIRKEANAKQRDRYRAVLLALEGKTTAEIRDKLDRSKNFVQRWVYFYRDHGLDRIRPLKQPGRSPKLPREQHQAFLDHINGSDRILRGQDITELIEKEFGVVYSLSAVYELLHRLGYEPLKPRPVNPKKNPEQEQAWKQRAPLLSKRSATPNRTGGSKSGSKTSVDSDRRDA